MQLVGCCNIQVWLLAVRRILIDKTNQTWLTNWEKNQNFNEGNYEQALKEVFLELDRLILRPSGRRQLDRLIRVK